MEIPLTEEAARALTFQTYADAPAIEGVIVTRLEWHRSLEGSFMELARLTDGAIDALPLSFQPRQVSVSTAVPGRINAFHVHPKVRQDELWCVLRGIIRVWLVDLRADSPTVGVKRSHILTGEMPEWLHIPAGVAHGYRTGADGALLLYMANQQFSREEPNEGRLPWDAFGRDLWENDMG